MAKSGGEGWFKKSTRQFLQGEGELPVGVYKGGKCYPNVQWSKKKGHNVVTAAEGLRQGSVALFDETEIDAACTSATLWNWRVGKSLAIFRAEPL